MIPYRRPQKQHHLTPFVHANKTSGNHGDGEDAEFQFWGAREREDYQNFSEGGTGNIDFGAQFDESYDEYSSHLLKKNPSRRTTYESYPLLPYNHKYSNFSPRSRLQVIADGRKELMDMIHSMPESSYELSLKDIVDEQLVEKTKEEEKVIAEKSFNFNADAKNKNCRKKKLVKSESCVGQISRSGSMEKEVFLIKMFIPSFLNWKSKDKAGTASKVSPRPSFDEYENHGDNKEKFLKRSAVPGCGNNSRRRFSSSTSRSNSNSSMYPLRSDTDSFRGCLAFFCAKKSKDRRQRLRIF